MTQPFYRDKDYVKTDSGVIFKIKTYAHPSDSVIAFPRFIPYTVIPMRLWEHTWMIDGKEYSRFDVRVTETAEIKAVFSQFRQVYPQFAPHDLPGMVRVSHASITEHLTPQAGLRRLRSLAHQDGLQRATCRFAGICEALGVPREALGITDSLLFDAHTIGFSDIDFVICGAANYRRVVVYLQSLGRDSEIRLPSVEEWQARYIATEVKDMPLSPRVYALHKVRKCEESSIDGHKLSLFAVRGDADQLGDRWEDLSVGFSRLGPLRITGTVVDASEAMFRPSIYQVQTDLPMLDCPETQTVTIINHRREYISQVQEGERIVAFGLAYEKGGKVVLEIGSLELRGSDYLVAEELQ
jgi:predicted nucleotidyltransferase